MPMFLAAMFVFLLAEIRVNKEITSLKEICIAKSSRSSIVSILRSRMFSDQSYGKENLFYSKCKEYSCHKHFSVIQPGAGIIKKWINISVLLTSWVNSNISSTLKAPEALEH